MEVANAVLLLDSTDWKVRKYMNKLWAQKWTVPPLLPLKSSFYSKKI
jgi:hypothetical protein